MLMFDFPLYRWICVCVYLSLFLSSSFPPCLPSFVPPFLPSSPPPSGKLVSSRPGHVRFQYWQREGSDLAYAWDPGEKCRCHPSTSSPNSVAHTHCTRRTLPRRRNARTHSLTRTHASIQTHSLLHPQTSPPFPRVREGGREKGFKQSHYWLTVNIQMYNEKHRIWR